MNRRALNVYTIISIAALVALSFIIYHKALSFGFVYDDNEQVLRNRWITSASFLPDIFRSHTFGFSEDSYQALTYRPVFIAIYLFEYAIFGLNAWGWHLVNILLHAANSIAVFFTVAFLLERHEPASKETPVTLYLPAFAAAALFASFPVNTEVVSWVGCIPELMYTLLCLSAFYMYMASRENGKLLYILRLASVVLYFVAMLVKETAIILPALLFIYDCIKYRGERIISLAKIKRYIPYAVTAAAYMAIRIAVLGNMAPPEKLHTNLTGFQYLINAFPMILRYLRELVLPIEYPLQRFSPYFSMAEPVVVISVLVVLSIPVLVFLFRKRIKPVYLLALFFFIPLLPALYSPGVSRTPFADRYLYSPSIGLALFVAIILKIAISRKTALKAAVAAFAVILAANSAWACKKSLIWKDDLTLWNYAAKGAPDNYIALYSIGYAHYKEGRVDEAIPMFEKALNLNLASEQPDPTMLLIMHRALAGTYLKKGLLENAAREYNELLRLAPEDFVASYNLATIYRQKGLLNEAVELYRTALLFAKEPFMLRDIHYNMGQSYMGLGRRAEAAASFEKALELSPDDPMILNSLREANPAQ
ncbi:MAG: tetratricopeptide repeat protein [Deltaproteobacteria bacterium]|nr:tetratricopeptide repeat protein [Deltaproteobacteria bacterium]